MKRLLGASLLVLGLFPVYRALDPSGGAPFRQAVVQVAETTLEYAWWGSLLVVLLAVLLAFLLRDRAVRLGDTLGTFLERPTPVLFAVGVGILAFALSLVVSKVLYQDLYTNMDEIASGIHARYMASGQLAGKGLVFPEGWLVPNTLIVEEGWVSQYPPSHLALMAIFFRLGIPHWVGPVLMGLMVWILALSFPRLLPDRNRTARMAAILVAVSPFLLALGGGSFNHLTAGFAGAALLYSALRAREGSAAWGFGAGMAVGLMVTARPWIGLVLGTLFPLLLWGPGFLAGRRAWFLRRGLATVAGGLPFAVGLGIYNHRLFGGITRLGYLAAFGANHRLGFHLDPWGNMYGLDSALAFTSIDLLAVGVHFLETPLPLTVLVGGYLLLGPRLPGGGGFLLAWGLLPVLANAFYWFHDPRMMFEAAPAWILLAVLAAREVISWCGSPERHPAWMRLGHTTAWAIVVALAMAAVWGVPNRWRSYRWTEEALGRIQVPVPPSEGPTLVFVHASWNERLSATLQGAGGMRQDSVISALRRNTSCQLHLYAVSREARGREGRTGLVLPEIDHRQTAGTPPGMVQVTSTSNITVRSREGETIAPECLRQMEADRFGAVALAPLLWQGDLPGIEVGEPLFVRDLGPEKNSVIRSHYPRRQAYVFSPFAPGAPPTLLPYEDAMEILWGPEPEAAAGEMGEE